MWVEGLEELVGQALCGFSMKHALCSGVSARPHPPERRARLEVCGWWVAGRDAAVLRRDSAIRSSRKAGGRAAELWRSHAVWIEMHRCGMGASVRGRVSYTCYDLQNTQASWW